MSPDPEGSDLGFVVGRRGARRTDNQFPEQERSECPYRRVRVRSRDGRDLRRLWRRARNCANLPAFRRDEPRKITARNKMITIGTITTWEARAPSRAPRRGARLRLSPREHMHLIPSPSRPPTPTREPPAPAKPAPAAAPKADPRWAEVSARYARIFDRLDALEKRALPTPTGNPREPASNSRRDDTCDAARHILNDLVGTRGAPAGCATFMRVPSCYYDEPLEFRRECVGGASVDHMCKTIVMENTKCVNDDTADRANSRWYLVVVQYTAKLNQQKLQKYLHELNNRDGRKCGKKNFHMRLAKEEDSERLTGYVKGAVCPFGCVDAKMPVIFSDKITRLAPDTFWLGAGEVDLKIGMSAAHFVDAAKPYVADITY